MATKITQVTNVDPFWEPFYNSITKLKSRNLGSTFCQSSCQNWELWKKMAFFKRWFLDQCFQVSKIPAKVDESLWNGWTNEHDAHGELMTPVQTLESLRNHHNPRQWDPNVSWHSCGVLFWYGNIWIEWTESDKISVGSWKHCKFLSDVSFLCILTGAGYSSPIIYLCVVVCLQGSLKITLRFPIKKEADQTCWLSGFQSPKLRNSSWDFPGVPTAPT